MRNRRRARLRRQCNVAVLALVTPSHRLVLDVGCGAGGNARALHALGKIVDGITLSPEEARQASAWCRDVTVYNVEQGLPESARGPYDLCLCSHVIEHLRDPSPLLTAVRRILAPNGGLLVALPNILQFRHRLELLRGRFEYESGGIMDSTHVRWYTWESAGACWSRTDLLSTSASPMVAFRFRSFGGFSAVPSFGGWIVSPYNGFLDYAAGSTST